MYQPLRKKHSRPGYRSVTTKLSSPTCAAVAAAKGLKGIAGLFRRASTAEDLALLKSGELSPSRATRAVQTSIKEVGVLATSEQAGFGTDVYQLHKYLPVESAEAADVLAVELQIRAATKAASGAASFNGKPVSPTFSSWTGFHGSDITPSQLQSAGGFQASGSNMDLYEHIIAKGEPSAFRGTTAQPLDALGRGGAGRGCRERQHGDRARDDRQRGDCDHGQPT